MITPFDWSDRIMARKTRRKNQHNLIKLILLIIVVIAGACLVIALTGCAPESIHDCTTLNAATFQPADRLGATWTVYKNGQAVGVAMEADIRQCRK